MNYGPGSYIDSGGTGDSEVVTRTFNIHRFDPHPRRKMLVIHGELHVTVATSLCPVILAEDTRDFKKIISLENLSKDTDREAVISEVINQCPFIDLELRPHLGVAIEFIRKRKYDESGFVITPSNSSAGDHPHVASKSNASTPTGDFPEYFETTETLSSQASEAELNEKVDMSSLDTYVELLYEEALVDKARGARCIGKLAKAPENLVAIAYHETALNALFRTLREDHKKSMDLTTHIMSVCLSYAQFKDFHALLVTNKITSVTFDLVEFELQRYEKWRLEVARRQDIVESRSEFPGSAGSFQKAKNDFEKMRLKFVELTKRQDFLLSLAFDVILFMSENHGLHLEILSRGIVPMLMDTLGRKNVDLLKVVLTFLKNLSVFLPCKVQMGQLYIGEKLAQLLDANIPNQIIHACLQLLFNLSFDTKIRHKMVIFGLLPKFAFYLEDSVLQSTVRKLLYVMSMDKKVRAKFSGISQITPILVRLLFENREEAGRSSLDVSGLLVNLALNKKCAQAMMDNDGLVSLLQQAFETEDEILMKIVRNLSTHPGTKELFAAFICDLARAVRDATSQEFILECIGTLGNLDLPNIDFCKLLQEFELVPWMHSVFSKSLSKSASSGSREESKSLRGKQKVYEETTGNILHELLVLLGTCSVDAECVELLIEDGILELLIKILRRQADTPQVQALILFIFYKMCGHTSTKNYIQEDTPIPKLVLEYLQNENDQVQQICEAIMNLFGENDEAWMDRLREKRFRIHNEAWIEMTERSVGVASGEGEEEDPFGFAYGITRQKSGFDIDMQSSASASETLMTEDDESGDDFEEEEGSLALENPRNLHHSEINRVDFDAGDKADGKIKIFDRFKAQYEHDMRAKRQWEQQGDANSDDDEEEEDLDKPESDLKRNF